MSAKPEIAGVYDVQRVWRDFPILARAGAWQAAGIPRQRGFLAAA